MDMTHWRAAAVPLLAAVAAGAVAIPSGAAAATDRTISRLAAVSPQDPVVAATEQARKRTGRVRDVTLTAAPAKLRLGKRTVTTWAFNGKVPGPEIRVTAGDVLRATVINGLPQPLTIHWHGVALRNDMDGVPGVTQNAIAPGETSTYEFTVPDAGTFFYHPHVGTELDRGLYGALIADPSRKPRSAPRDFTLLLDDWIDGTGKSPDDVLAGLKQTGSATDMGASPGGSMPGMPGMPGMGTTTKSPLGTDIEDIEYPYYLINGRPATDPETLRAKPGQRLRLRLINAASNTPFRVALGGGRRLTVVATDGFAVKPVTVDTLVIGMGERYDVLVTAPRRGAVPIVAQEEGQNERALAVLRSGPGRAPMADARPMTLMGDLLRYSQLHATTSAALPSRKPDRTYSVSLTGDMKTYTWGIAAPQQDGMTLPVKQGERVRLVLRNPTAMWHPMHLHGHTFQLVTGSGPGARKDTVNLPPKSTVTVDLDADNPGQWALHCHNIYHAEAGMVTTLNYMT